MEILRLVRLSTGKYIIAFHQQIIDWNTARSKTAQLITHFKLPQGVIITSHFHYTQTLHHYSHCAEPALHKPDGFLLLLPSLLSVTLPSIFIIHLICIFPGTC